MPFRNRRRPATARKFSTHLRWIFTKKCLINWKFELTCLQRRWSSSLYSSLRASFNGNMNWFEFVLWIAHNQPEIRIHANVTRRSHTHFGRIYAPTTKRCAKRRSLNRKAKANKICSQRKRKRKRKKVEFYALWRLFKRPTTTSQRNSLAAPFRMGKWVFVGEEMAKTITTKYILFTRNPAFRLLFRVCELRRAIATHSNDVRRLAVSLWNLFHRFRAEKLSAPRGF